MNKFTLILDSSQLHTIYSCIVKWDFTQNKKLYKMTAEGGEYPTSQAMLGGTYGHKLMEVYDRTLMETNNALEAMKLMWASNQWLQPGSKFFKDSDSIESFLKEQATLNPDRKSLIDKRVTGSIMRFATQPYRVIGVEQGFSYPLYEDNLNLFILEGRFDTLIELMDNRYFLDHKLQDQGRDLYPKNIQFRNYSLVSGCNTGLINYIRLTQKEDQTTYKRVLTPFSPDELQLWRDELIQKFFQVKEFLTDGMLYAPQTWRNRAHCGHYEYDECWFTQLCNETNPELIQIRIDQNYGIREKLWKPW